MSFESKKIKQSFHKVKLDIKELAHDSKRIQLALDKLIDQSKKISQVCQHNTYHLVEFDKKALGLSKKNNSLLKEQQVLGEKYEVIFLMNKQLLKKIEAFKASFTRSITLLEKNMSVQFEQTNNRLDELETTKENCMKDIMEFKKNTQTALEKLVKKANKIKETTELLPQTADTFVEKKAVEPQETKEEAKKNPFFKRLKSWFLLDDE